MMSDEGYERLVGAVLELAVKDVKKGPGKRVDSPRAKNYNSAVAFFKSDWFEALTGADGERLLKVIEEGKS